jgi:hypothetical protein
MEKTKTLQEIIDAGYEFPTSIDELTQELITVWFGLRRVCNNALFKRYFDRQLNLSYPYYRQLMRIDPTISDFDWLIENYYENKSNSNKQNENKHEKTGATTNSGTTTTGGTTTTTTTGTAEGSATTSTNNSDAQTNVTGGYTRAEGFSRANPMSAEYDANDLNNSADSIAVGTITITGFHGNMAKPKITNPTASTDELSTDKHASDTKGTSTGESTSTDSNTHTDKTTGTIDNTVKNDFSVGVNETDTNSNTETAEETHISSGRNTDIATLIDRARGAIINSRAWDYLYRNLNLCFMQVYEEEDFYE